MCIRDRLNPGDRHTIEFVNVSFRYPNTEKFVLKDVSITIHSGERLAIVGYNGAGKSTFIKLICRLYEPTGGKILYNGIDISQIDRQQYMSLLSVVFQDYKIFSFSIKDNLCLNHLYAVSYTHLDVYKRQVTTNTGTSSS